MQDLNDKITGSTLTAAEWNEVPSEIQNVIEGLGITLSGGDLNQLGKAVAGYVANGQFYTDSGAADAYVLTTVGSKQSPTAYTDGMVVEFEPANVNTGASITINVAGLGVKNGKLRGGADPAAGEVSGRTRFVFDSGNDRFELDRTGRVKTTIVTATDASWASQQDTKVITFTAIGAGGGGGGANGGGAGTSAAGGGGGGGGASVITTNIIDTSYNITIGAGGGGGSPGTGGTGGDTTVVDNGPGINVNVTGNGGVGGDTMAGTSGRAVANPGVAGSAIGGNLNIGGGQGGVGIVVAGDTVSAGNSGTSMLGGATQGNAGNGPGVNGLAYGSGGSGAGAQDGGAQNGGDGGDGVVIIKEFF